jgi:hypothetical protein
MSGYDLPDDWHAYWLTCADCGVRYHASGTDECGCEDCPHCGRCGPDHAKNCPDCHDVDGECPLCGAVAGDPCHAGCEVKR